MTAQHFAVENIAPTMCQTFNIFLLIYSRGRYAILISPCICKKLIAVHVLDPELKI